MTLFDNWYNAGRDVVKHIRHWVKFLFLRWEIAQHKHYRYLSTFTVREKVELCKCKMFVIFNKSRPRHTHRYLLVV
jgi:hypothetical protein